jgi:hypothetical protein
MVDIAELANAAEFSDNIEPSAVREAISQARITFFITLRLLSQGTLPIVEFQGCTVGRPNFAARPSTAAHPTIGERRFG